MSTDSTEEPPPVFRPQPRFRGQSRKQTSTVVTDEPAPPPPTPPKTESAPPNAGA